MDILSKMTGDALKDLARTHKNSLRNFELEEIEHAFRNLKSYRSDLDKLLRAKKIPDKEVDTVKKLLSDVDRCLRIPAASARLRDIDDYIDKVKKFLKR